MKSVVKDVDKRQLEEPIQNVISSESKERVQTPEEEYKRRREVIRRRKKYWKMVRK